LLLKKYYEQAADKYVTERNLIISRLIVKLACFIIGACKCAADFLHACLSAGTTGIYKIVLVVYEVFEI
jgi:hypothetical protein